MIVTESESLESIKADQPAWGTTLPHLVVPYSDEWLLGLLLRCDLANGWFAGTTARLAAVAPLAESPRVSPGFFITATLFDLHRLASLIAVSLEAVGGHRIHGSARQVQAHTAAQSANVRRDHRFTGLSCLHRGASSYAEVPWSSPGYQRVRFTAWRCNRAAYVAGHCSRGASGRDRLRAAYVVRRGRHSLVNWTLRHMPASVLCVPRTTPCSSGQAATHTRARGC